LTLVLQRAGLTTWPAKSIEPILTGKIDQPVELILSALSESDLSNHIKQIRQEILAPLILVVNDADEALHYDLLEDGADLVVVRPFSARLLIAQVRTLLRRAGTTPIVRLPSLSVNGLTLDPSTRIVHVNNQPDQRLTHLEFRLLHTLILNRNQTIPTETIVEQVWGYDDKGDRKLVRGLISRLRAKVEVDPHEPHYILTVPGVGYTFEAD
ncbi:MAG: response regulator transcription factor, partial [Chloroflexota bacterium]